MAVAEVVSEPRTVGTGDPMSAAFAVVEASGDGFALRLLDDAADELGDRRTLTRAELSGVVDELEGCGVRWVWDTAAVYPALLTLGRRVARAHDLRRSRAVLRLARASERAYADVPIDGWDAPTGGPVDAALFDLIDQRTDAGDPVGEFRRQLAAVAAAAEPARMRLLLAAESAGALAAAEMRFTGLPWRRDEHERLLEEALGPRPAGTARPDRLEVLAERIRLALDAPALNPDSPQEVLRALRRRGLQAESTRSFQLRRIEHPAIAPLLEYKKLARLHTANGWQWLDAWVRDGRFRPDYVVGGVVTGRWATRGGGAMQLPKQIRAAVVADPGWRLVVADAAQLEPRVLAGMARDLAMADAGRGRDLYDGIVATGAVPDRTAAKYGVLAAMYGATQGRGGRLVPRLARWFPEALGLVEDAARRGERGQQVETLLGRTSPKPGSSWHAIQAEAAGVDAGEDAAGGARAAARRQGRFTRNFVVQGTAAEWALCWMADLRLRLHALAPGSIADAPHLVYFLHDEVIVHTPAEHADAATDAVGAAAASAGRLLFGDFPVDFPLATAIVDRYSDA